MIRYTYACPQCGAHAETRHSIKDTPLVACPECGRAMQRALPGTITFAVKGGTVHSHVHKAQVAKHEDDIAHAESVAKAVKETYQPKARQHLAKVLDGAAAKQPSGIDDGPAFE